MPISGANGETGWHRPANSIYYGQVGLVGGWWKKLGLQFDFKTPMTFYGTETDYNQQPYTIRYGPNYENLVGEFKGSTVFAKPIVAQKIQILWMSTTGTNGIHFRFNGCDKPGK